MTKEQIENGKIICCEFMGLKPVLESIDGTYAWSDQPWFSTRNATYERTMNDIVNYAKYDSDWNWLMGVAGKINDLVGDDPKLLYMHNLRIIENALRLVDIDAVFLAVVEFIQFYNKSKS